MEPISTTVSTFSTSSYSILIEFIGVLIESFLYSRNLYPRSFFIPSIQFGIAVCKCRHPILCGYVETLLASIGLLLKKNAISSFSIVRCEKENRKPIEKLSLFIRSLQNPFFPLPEREVISLKIKLRTLLWKLFTVEKNKSMFSGDRSGLSPLEENHSLEHDYYIRQNQFLTQELFDIDLINDIDTISKKNEQDNFIENRRITTADSSIVNSTFYTLVTSNKDKSIDMDISNFFNPSLPWCAINEYDDGSSNPSLGISSVLATSMSLTYQASCLSIDILLEKPK